jgi:hypothetical protein
MIARSKNHKEEELAETEAEEARRTIATGTLSKTILTRGEGKLLRASSKPRILTMPMRPRPQEILTASLQEEADSK